MSTFDPTRAVLADDEDDGMDDFMASLDAKAKKFRSMMIADAFKELATTAKGERKQLVEAACSKMADMLEKERPLIVAQLAAEMKADKDRMRTFSDKIAAAQDRLAATLAKSAADTTPDVRRVVAEEMKSAISSITIPPIDPTAFEAMIDAAVKKHTPPRPSYRFEIERDAFARVSNVTAIPH